MFYDRSQNELIACPGHPLQLFYSSVSTTANEAPRLPQHTEKGATGLERALNIRNINNDKKRKC